MSDEKPAREPIGEDARIDALEGRLKAAREREEKRNAPQVKGSDASKNAPYWSARPAMRNSFLCTW